MICCHLSATQEDLHVLLLVFTLYTLCLASRIWQLGRRKKMHRWFTASRNMPLYHETSPLFTQSVTHTHALAQRLTFIDGTSSLAATDRKLLALSSARGTASEEDTRNSSIIFTVSLSMQDALRPTSAPWGERWQGDGWGRVFNFHTNRKLLPTWISKCFQWACLKTDVWKDFCNFPPAVNAFFNV